MSSRLLPKHVIALARLMMIVYGQYQDETIEVKLTDVDYKVNEPVNKTL